MTTISLLQTGNELLTPVPKTKTELINQRIGLTAASSVAEPMD